MLKNVFLIFIFISPLLPGAQQIKTGLDQIGAYHALFEGKRLGLITNQTAYNSAGRHIVDLFLEMPGVKVTALFGPEHGIRGEVDAGKKINSATDPLTQIPVFSLYGQTRKPTPEMLQKVDVLVFDIQDIGSRFYTYIWTMALAMEAAAEQGLPFIVLDRTNPLNGLQVEGNLLEADFSSFVGMFPIPVRHGMTIGELAQMFNGQGWLKNGIKADLEIIPLKNWRRSMWYDQTGLDFRKPSPNIPNLETATVYPGLCLLEGTNVSEGRGTQSPFLQFGTPWIDNVVLVKSLNDLNLEGVRFTTCSFSPKSIPGTATHPKYENQVCNGVRIYLTERSRLKAYQMGIHIVKKIYDLYPNRFQWKATHFDRLCGTDKIRIAISNGQDMSFLLKFFAKQEKEFKFARKPYLLYP